MPLNMTKQALVALKDHLEKADPTGIRALRLVADSDRKLHFVLDTSRKSDLLLRLDELTIMIIDPKLSSRLGEFTLDVRHTAEGTYWTLIKNKKGPDAAS
jgi:hypothetical protein